MDSNEKKIMSEKEKLTLLEETIEVEEGSLSPVQDLTDVPEYDSMSKLSILVMMEDEFGVKLSGQDIRSFKTVGDILDRMKKE